MEKILWFILVPSTTIYLIISFMNLIGISHSDTDIDSDSDTNPNTQFFTFKNLLSFLVGLSWGSLIGLKELNLSETYSVIYGVLMGGLLTLAQMILFYFITKFDQKQEPSLESALNKQGTCYLEVPGENGGIGKVSVSVNGALKVLPASTDFEKISTGSRIKVVSIDNNILKVVRI